MAIGDPRSWPAWRSRPPGRDRRRRYRLVDVPRRHERAPQLPARLLERTRRPDGHRHAALGLDRLRGDPAARPRGWALAGLVPLLLVAFMTSSRGALLAALVGVVVVVALRGQRPQGRRGRRRRNGGRTAGVARRRPGRRHSHRTRHRRARRPGAGRGGGSRPRDGARGLPRAAIGRASGERLGPAGPDPPSARGLPGRGRDRGDGSGRPRRIEERLPRPAGRVGSGRPRPGGSPHGLEFRPGAVLGNGPRSLRRSSR